jgi:hypothetical protein
MTIAYISCLGNVNRSAPAIAREMWSLFPFDVFLFDVLDLEPVPGAQGCARLFDTPQKTRIVFETIFEPVVSDSKPISKPASLPCNDDLLLLCFRRNRDRSSLTSEKELISLLLCELCQP